MHEPNLRYCEHALSRMSRECISRDEVSAIVYYPAWRKQSYAARVEHYGYSDDGRAFRVVVDADGLTIVTVVSSPFR